MIAYIRRQIEQVKTSIVQRRLASAFDALSRLSDAVDHIEEKLKNAVEETAEEFTERRLYYDTVKDKAKARDVTDEVMDRRPAGPADTANS